MKENLIYVVTQAFYGNRTGTEIDKDNVDIFIAGRLDTKLAGDPEKYRKYRKVVRIPGSEKLVLIYNQQAEEEELQRKKKLLEEKQYELKPLAVIPELNLEVYSRCLMCRMEENGEFSSLQKGDGEFVRKYLAV